MKTFLLLFVLFIFDNVSSVRVQRNNLESDILKKILDNYNRHVKPSDGNSTLVKANLYVRYVQSLCTEKGLLTTQLTFRLKWTDRRLNYEDDSVIPYVSLTDELIWTPDIFFSNDRDSKQEQILKPNTLIRIKRNGEVLMSKRITLVTTCPMNLVQFPFDKQECSVRIASYGYTTDELKLEWENEQSVILGASSTFNLRGFTLQKLTQRSSQTKTNTGLYSYLEMTYHFKRESTYFFLTAFIPFSMTVIISWSSFWIHTKDQLLKSSICLFSLLSMVISLTIMGQSWPKVSYAKAIDVFSGTCVTFIFGAFIESIVVYVIADLRSEKRLPNAAHIPSITDDAQADKTVNEKAKKYLKCILDSRSEKVDCISRVAFPIAYLLFCIIYFLAYC